MVAEPWILKLGSQVSSNFKHALNYSENSTKSLNKKQEIQDRQTIGILSFEVANLMSKVIHLHKSLTENEILKLKNEILVSEGIKALVSTDEKKLLELALAEKFDELYRVASVVSRLGKKCTIPALQGFEHVYGDIVSGIIDIKELGFLVKDMESMVRRMERYVASTVSLYTEMEVMNEFEAATKKFRQNQLEETMKAYEQKLTWQKQDVKHLKDISLWNQTFDKVVELLARTVCTVYARLYIVFRNAELGSDVITHSSSRSQVGSVPRGRLKLGPKSTQLDVAVDRVRKDVSLANYGSCKINGYCHSGLGKRTFSLKPNVGSQKNGGGSFRPEGFSFACGMGPGRLLMECLSLSSPACKVDSDDRVSYDDQSSQISGIFSTSSDVKKEHPNLSRCFVHAINRGPRSGDQGSCGNGSKFGTKNRLLAFGASSTVGGSALALHYANVIIVLEKLLCYPHLVGDEARDDLYQMLPTSLRMTLKTRLKSYVEDLAIYDAPLAHDWRERLGSLLMWLAPLAHNMIRWQSERNFEQHQIVTRTNVLLVQTLYFADREKTEAAICDLLLGLNYICRYEQQQNALLDCASSFDFDECMEWQMQASGSFHA